jgi:hypothetical protein
MHKKLSIISHIFTFAYRLGMLIFLKFSPNSNIYYTYLVKAKNTTKSKSYLFYTICVEEKIKNNFK